MGMRRRVLKELYTDRAATEKPSITDIYAAGSLIGLDRNDIGRLYRRNADSDLKFLLTKYWYVFLPVGILVAVLIFLLLYHPYVPGFGMYGHPTSGPFQPMYGVATKRASRKRIFPF